MFLELLYVLLFALIKMCCLVRFLVHLLWDVLPKFIIYFSTIKNSNFFTDVSLLLHFCSLYYFVHHSAFRVYYEFGFNCKISWTLKMGGVGMGVSNFNNLGWKSQKKIIVVVCVSHFLLLCFYSGFHYITFKFNVWTTTMIWWEEWLHH